MEIGLMSAWNSDSGASVHAELIGREWVKQGHNLTVFSFLKKSFHGTVVTLKDEAYVKRCFTTSLTQPQFLDPTPFLSSDYQVFVVQDLGMLPKEPLLKIFPQIKKRAKTINIIHDNKPSKDPLFWKFDFDAIVCFDQRYKTFLKKFSPEKKIYIIPYPCYPLKTGDMEKARNQLRLPLDKKIIFTFGQAAKYAPETLLTISKLKKEFPVLVLAITKDKEAILGFQKAKKSFAPILLKEKTLSLQELYEYLYAADCLIFNKKSKEGIVVPSTIFLCLGSGCPVLAYDSNFVEMLSKEVMKYSNSNEFYRNLISIFNKDKKWVETKKAAKEFVQQNQASQIAKEYINLFQKI